MIYHVPSWVGFTLWGLHCAGRLRPWKSARWAIAHHLESPGTKAYTIKEARSLFSRFARVSCRAQLGTGDLLLMRRSAKYESGLHRILWRLYPRPLVRAMGNRFGLGLLIEAVK